MEHRIVFWGFIPDYRTFLKRYGANPHLNPATGQASLEGQVTMVTMLAFLLATLMEWS